MKDRTRVEKLAKHLIDEMRKVGLSTHPSFEPLRWLHHDLLEETREDEGLLAHVYAGGKASSYVDMARAEALYRHWCKLHGVKRASMARNAKVIEGKRQDCPCLVYVSRKLDLKTHVVAAAWRSRKKLRK